MSKFLTLKIWAGWYLISYNVIFYDMLYSALAEDTYTERPTITRFANKITIARYKKKVNFKGIITK